MREPGLEGGDDGENAATPSAECEDLGLTWPNQGDRCSLRREVIGVLRRKSSLSVVALRVRHTLSLVDYNQFLSTFWFQYLCFYKASKRTYATCPPSPNTKYPRNPRDPILSYMHSYAVLRFVVPHLFSSPALTFAPGHSIRIRLLYFGAFRLDYRCPNNPMHPTS